MPLQPNKKPELRVDFHQLRTKFKKGALIFSEGDERGSAYIIEHGTVEISVTKDGKPIPLVKLGQGEVFGEAALLGEGRRTATARAVEDSEVFMISPDLVRERITKLDPIVGLLMSLLVSRYRKWRHKSTDEIAGLDEVPKEQENLGIVDRADMFMRDLQEQREVALNELRMAQEISNAIEKDQFGPYVQPIVSLPEQKIIGFEALIRWQHPLRGMIPPVEFIPVAERTNVVWDLDMLMLRHVCRIAPLLQKTAGAVGRKFYVSANLSGVHFDSEELVTRVADIMRESSIDPAHLVLEITESALMGDPMVAEKVLRDLKKLGLRIALDDFGTGYSSLGYLHRFPIDILKIDRSFVQDIHRNRKSLDIMRAIVGLGRTFNLSIVAEGIESEDEAAALAGIGCDNGQGYFFSKPLPIDKAHDFIGASIARNG